MWIYITIYAVCRENDLGKISLEVEWTIIPFSFKALEMRMFEQRNYRKMKISLMYYYYFHSTLSKTNYFCERSSKKYENSSYPS